jgi:NACHT domain
MRKSLGRGAGVLLLVLVVVSATYWSYRLLAGKGISWAGDFGSAVSMFTGVFALMLPAGFRLTRWLRGPMPLTDPDIPQARNDLATALRWQWKKEEQLRRVNDPRPLPVRWTVTSRAQEAMPGTPATAIGDPADFSDRFDGIADTFNGVRSRRLVILGEAGAGKSVLVMKLAEELLSVREGDMPLPVIVPASAWDPEQDLFDWIADQLGVNYSGLAVPVKSATGEVTTLASTLVRAGVIPIVDGLDELPAARRGHALARLNSAGSDFPLVVTSRPDEYLDAVAETGRGISGAMVVELLPLRLTEIKAYLQEATAATVDGRWRGVFERMDGEPNGVLARTLATPLMLWLARTVYERDASDPGEILDEERFGDRETIENHLLDAFVPAIYAEGRPAATGFACTPAQAQRWLAYLAAQVSRAGSPEIAWWRLGRAARLSASVVTVFRVLLLFNVWWWLVLQVVRPYVHRHPRSGLRERVRDIAFDGTVGHLAWPDVHPVLRAGKAIVHTASLDSLGVYPWNSLLLFELALVALVILLSALDLKLTEESAWAIPKTLRFRVMPVVRDVATSAVLFGVVGVVAVGLGTLYPPAGGSVHLTHVLGESSTWRTIAFFALFGLSSLSSAFVDALDVSRSASPREALRMDRRAGAVRTVFDKILFAVPVYLWCGTTVVAAYGVYALAAVALDLSMGVTSGSHEYAEARIGLACGRLMPWRMMSFLVDAHRRGALRQVGAVYEFRHVRLRERLAARHRRWPQHVSAAVRAVLGEDGPDALVRAAHRVRDLAGRAVTAIATAVVDAAVPDETEALARGWQVFDRGFVRVYRDPRFDARAEAVAQDEDDDITR